MKRYLYYCSMCKLRFQHQNFGHGYPQRDAEGAALCPYCSGGMLEVLDEEFPESWVEERAAVEPANHPE